MGLAGCNWRDLTETGLSLSSCLRTTRVQHTVIDRLAWVVARMGRRRPVETFGPKWLSGAPGHRPYFEESLPTSVSSKRKWKRRSGKCGVLWIQSISSLIAPLVSADLSPTTSVQKRTSDWSSRVWIQSELWAWTDVDFH